MRVVGSVEKWRRALLNADIAMIPRTEGGATALGQQTLSDLPRRRASVKLVIWKKGSGVAFPNFFSRWYGSKLC